MPLYFDLDGLERALWRGGAVPNRASDKQLLKKACREVWNTPYESDFVRRRAIDFMDLIDYDTDMRAQRRRERYAEVGEGTNQEDGLYSEYGGGQQASYEDPLYNQERGRTQVPAIDNRQRGPSAPARARLDRHSLGERGDRTLGAAIGVTGRRQSDLGAEEEPEDSTVDGRVESGTSPDESLLETKAGTVFNYGASMQEAQSFPLTGERIPNEVSLIVARRLSSQHDHSPQAARQPASPTPSSAGRQILRAVPVNLLPTSADFPHGNPGCNQEQIHGNVAEDDLEGKSGAGLKYSPEAGLGGGSDTAGKKSLWTSENLSGAKGHADASDRKSLCDDDVCGGEQDHGGTGVVTREGTFDSPRSPCAEGYKRTAPQESPAAEDERSPARESSYSDMSLGGSPPTNMAALAEEWETGSSRGDQRIGNGGEKRRWDDAERVRKRASLGGGRWMSGPLFDEPAPIYGEPRPFYDGLGAFCDDSGKVDDNTIVQNRRPQSLPHERANAAPVTSLCSGTKSISSADRLRIRHSSAPHGPAGPHKNVPSVSPPKPVANISPQFRSAASRPRRFKPLGKPTSPQSGAPEAVPGNRTQVVAKDGTPAEPGREPVVLGSVKRGTGPNEAPAPAASAESDLAKSGMKHEGSAVGGFVEGLTTEAMESPQSKEVAGEKKGETAASCSQGLVAGTLREGGEASLAAPPPGQGESPGELPPMFHRAGSHLHALDLVRLARSALAAAGEEKSEAEGGPKVATVGLAEQAGESQRMEGKAAKGEGSEEGGADDAKSIASAADEEEKIEKVATGDEGVDEAPAKQDGVARPVSAEKVVQFEEEEEDGGFASEEFERKENVAPKESDPVNQDVGNGQAGRLFGAKMIENKALVKGPTGGATKSAEAEESPEVGARSSRGLGPKRAENGKVSGDDGKRWGPGEQRSGGQGTDNSGRMGRTSGPGDGSKGHASRLGDVSKGQIGRFGDVSKRQISRFGDVSKKGEAAQQNVAGAPRMNSALGAGVIGIAATGAKPSGKGSGPGQPRDSARHHSQVGMDLGNNVFHDPSECPEFAIAGSGSRPAIDHMWEKISVARTSFPPSDNNEKRTRNSEDSFWDGRVSSPHIESIHRPRGKSLLDDTPDEPAPESAPNVHPDPPTRQIMTERTRRVAFGGVLRGEIPGGGRGTTVPAGGASVGGRTVEPVMPSVAGGVTAGRPNPGLTRRAAVGGLAIGVGRFGGTAGATEGGASGGGAQSLAGTEPAEARTMTGRANPVVVKKTGPSGVSAEEKKGPGGAQGGGKGGGKPPKGGGKGATAPGGTGPVWRG